MLITDVGEHDFLTYFSHILQSCAFFKRFIVPDGRSLKFSL